MLYDETRRAIKIESVTTYMLKTRPILADDETEGYWFEPRQVYCHQRLSPRIFGAFFYGNLVTRIWLVQDESASVQ